MAAASMTVDEPSFPLIVSLNVGGMLFTTSLETLRGFGFGQNADGSMLEAMFSGRSPTRRDAEGRFFIDRDGRHFGHILNYLRDGTLPASMPSAARRELERECSFYGLEALAGHLRADLLAPPLGGGSGADGGEGGGADGGAGGGADGGAGGGADVGAGGAGPVSARLMGAAEAAERVLNQCLEDWPEFPQHVQRVLGLLFAATGGALPEAADAAGDQPMLSARPRAASGVALDALVASSLQAEFLAATQIELAHVDAHSKAWRWSDRKTGVNSNLRAKLLLCHLQRLGYTCRIVPMLDKQEVSAYVLELELPMPK